MRAFALLLRALLICLIVVPILAFGVLWLIASYEPAYDVTGPDYDRYSRIFSELSQSRVTSRDAVDFAPLNGGDWRTVCLFGGYSNPLEEMRGLGAAISDRDQERLSEAGSRGFRVSQVEEFEMMIAYIDGQNQAHFLHFEVGIGSQGQNLHRCITKPATTLVLFTS